MLPTLKWLTCSPVRWEGILYNILVLAILKLIQQGVDFRVQSVIKDCGSVLYLGMGKEI